jgi:hypothetical protein
MAKQLINTGTGPNTGTGDPLRTAFTKINQNFADTEFSHIELTLTEVAFVGPEINFTKTNYGFEVDYIDNGLAITRGDEQGIFNIEVESEYDRDSRISPANTEWNADGWANLSNVTSRTYDTWRESLGTNVAQIVGQELIMHDLTNDKYWGIKFTQWTQGVDPMGAQGGGFAYTRQLIDVNAGKGITFPDNSIQRKAVSDVADLSDTQKLLGNGKTWFSAGTSSLWSIKQRSGGIRVFTSEPDVDEVETVVVNSFSGTTLYLPRDESTQLIQDYWDGNVDGGYKDQFFVINGVQYSGFVSTYDDTGWRVNLDESVTAEAGDPVTVKYLKYQTPVKWFDAEDYENAENFLSAKVTYYAYVEGRGQKTGTIWFVALSDEDGEFRTNDIETRSGNYADLEMDIRSESQNAVSSLWLTTNSETSEPISIMWEATMFYGENAKTMPEINDD